LANQRRPVIIKNALLIRILYALGEDLIKRIDEQIKKDIVDQLDWDDRVDASSIQVDVSQGAVTHTGMVPNYEARTAAQEDTCAMKGVAAMRNLITVSYPSELARASLRTFCKR
jgi:hypothetical protein